MANSQSSESFVDTPLHHLEAVESMPTAMYHGTVTVSGRREDINWTLEVPKDGLTYEGLTLLLPGYGCVKRHSRGERHANAIAGEATISYGPARVSGNIFDDLLQPQQLHVETANLVLSAVQNLIKTPGAVPGARRIDPHRVTVSPHSMGGFPAVELGLKRWAEIEAFIGKATVGFGSPNWRQLHRIRPLRTAIEIADYLTSDQVELTPKNAWRSAHYFGRNLGRTIGEPVNCLTTNDTERVIRLGDKGVPTAYLAFGRDGLVPFQPIEAVVREVVDEVAIMHDYGHLTPQRHPDETAAAVRSLRKAIS